MIGVSIKKEDVNEELIKKYSHLGYSHIEWKWNWDGCGKTPVPKEREMYYVKELCNKYKMSLSIHGPNGISIAEKIEPLRKVCIELWEDIFIASQKMDALWLVLELGSIGCSSNNFEKKAVRAQIAAKSICDILKRQNKDTKILIENVKKINADRHCYLGDNYNDILSIVDEVSNDGLGIIFDIGHAMINANPIESLFQLEKHINAFHVHVNHGQLDEHLAIDNLMDFKMHKLWDKVYHYYVNNIPIIFEFEPKHEAQYYINVIEELKKERK